jgi:hypothetical protein
MAAESDLPPIGFIKDVAIKTRFGALAHVHWGELKQENLAKDAPLSMNIITLV